MSAKPDTESQTPSGAVGGKPDYCLSTDRGVPKEKIMGSYEEFKKDILSITGIDLSLYKEMQMKRRIESLINKNGYSSYSSYFTALKEKKELFEEFMNYITINVSEFFRNMEQWDILENEIFPYLIEKFGKKLRIWSSACSTGQEPYSLVMLLAEYVPISHIHILATDIDETVMEKAKKGIYTKKEVENIPNKYLDKYFSVNNEGKYVISNDIKRCVEFKKLNLLSDEYPKAQELIICRNVMIYFTKEAKDDIYMKFLESLKKGGILFIGSTEQIIGHQKMGYETYKSFFYKKPII